MKRIGMHRAGFRPDMFPDFPKDYPAIMRDLERECAHLNRGHIVSHWVTEAQQHFVRKVYKREWMDAEERQRTHTLADDLDTYNRQQEVFRGREILRNLHMQQEHEKRIQRVNLYQRTKQLKLWRSGERFKKEFMAKYEIYNTALRALEEASNNWVTKENLDEHLDKELERWADREPNSRNTLNLEPIQETPELRCNEMSFRAFDRSGVDSMEAMRKRSTVLAASPPPPTGTAAIGVSPGITEKVQWKWRVEGGLEEARKEKEREDTREVEGFGAVKLKRGGKPVIEQSAE